MQKHTIMAGKVHVYRRENSRFWQCSAYLAGKNRRVSTKQDSLSHAKEFAEDWYLELRGKARSGEITNERTFKKAAEQFVREYEVITEGQRNAKYVQDHQSRLRNHLIPYFGTMPLSEITAGKVQEYRIFRLDTSGGGKAPSRSTMHHEIVTLRQVLKTAMRHGWLAALPDMSTPYGSSGKITRRAWFSHKEYKQLYTATRGRARTPPNPYYRWHAEQLHDYVLFMANTGLRPDEAKNLQHRDVTIVTDEWSGEQILEIEVRGKRGIGYCMSTPGAVRPYERLRDRPKPVEYGGADQPEAEPVYPEAIDPVFPGNHIRMFNNVLAEEKLKFDRDGNRRTAYSLRHTYICFRLMEGADIYQIAKNCRTSVEMIEKHYAAHIKTALDTSAINIRKERPRPAKEQRSSPRRDKSGRQGNDKHADGD